MKKYIYLSLLALFIFTLGNVQPAAAFNCTAPLVETADGSGCADPNFTVPTTKPTPLPAASDGSKAPIDVGTTPTNTGTTNTGGTQTTQTSTSGSGSTKTTSSNASNLTYTPLEPIPGLDQSGNADFGTLMSQVFKVLIILGALIAVGAFVFAGISYMTSDSVGSIDDAKKRLTSALLGLMLLIGAWVILYTINPQLIQFNGGLNPSTSSNNTSTNTTVQGCATDGSGCAYPTTSAGIVATDITAMEASAAEQTCETPTASNGLGGVVATGGGCPTQSSGSYGLKGTSYSGCQTIQTVAGASACFYNK